VKLFVAGVLLSMVCVTGVLLAAYTGQAGWLILSIVCGYLVWSS
jgi:hypothetical protein